MSLSLLPFVPLAKIYGAIARRSKARASSLPSSGRSVRRVTFQPSLPRLSSHRLAPTRWIRKPVDVPWPESSRGVACRSGVMICKYDVATAVSPFNFDARQAGEMAEAAGDSSLVLRRLYDRCNGVVAGRAFAAAEVDLAIGRERLAIVAVGASVGGGRMTCDQMIDRKRIFDRAQAVFQRVVRRTHADVPRAGNSCRGILHLSLAAPRRYAPDFFAARAPVNFARDIGR